MRDAIRRFVLGAGVGLLLALPGAGAAQAAPERLYVSAEDGGDIVVVDPAAGSVVGRIPVGKRPRGMKLSPDGKTLYVALSGSPRGGPGVDESKLPPGDRTADGVGAVDLASGKLVRTYKSGQDPEALDISRDGKKLFVSNEETAEASVVDVASGEILKHVAIGREPEGVTLRPDGKVVYVTSEEDGDVAAIDASTFALLARIPAGPRPRSITFAHNGALAFVTDEMGAVVTVLDVAKKEAVGTIKIVPQAQTVLGPRPMGSVLSRDGKLLFVSNGRGESVSVVDVGKRKQVRIVDGVGARPWGIALSRDGKKVYTANGPSDDVSVIDAASGKVEKRIKVGGLPWGVVVSGH
jgi:YVTN family beta-propeller protein